MKLLKVLALGSILLTAITSGPVVAEDVEVGQVAEAALIEVAVAEVADVVAVPPGPVAVSWQMPWPIVTGWFISSAALPLPKAHDSKTCRPGQPGATSKPPNRPGCGRR